MFRGKALEKLARPDRMVFKALELSHRPGYERPVDVPQQGVQRRWGVSSVVLDPGSKITAFGLGWVEDSVVTDSVVQDQPD
jgi:hypothetical protein